MDSSKYSFEVVDKTDEVKVVDETNGVSSKHGFEVVDETDEVSSKHVEVVDGTDVVSILHIRQGDIDVA
ncbi:chlorohydrolase [Streptococcus pneumoniae]|nr:chlorohydrolase [Streptococcus pneumoniae]